MNWIQFKEYVFHLYLSANVVVPEALLIANIFNFGEFIVFLSIIYKLSSY